MFCRLVLAERTLRVSQRPLLAPVVTEKELLSLRRRVLPDSVSRFESLLEIEPLLEVEALLDVEPPEDEIAATVELLVTD